MMSGFIENMFKVVHTGFYGMQDNELRLRCLGLKATLPIRGVVTALENETVDSNIENAHYP